MKMNNFTLMIASIFAVVFLIGFTSAAVNYVDTSGSSLTSLSGSGNHGNSVTIQFQLENDDATQNATEIVLTLPSLTSGSSTISAGNLSISGEPTEITNGSTSSTITLTVNVPDHQVAGIYTGTLDGAGKYTNSISFDNTISVVVASSPELSVSSATISSSSNSTTITIKNEGNTDLTNIDLNATGALDVTLSQSSISSLAAGESQTITATRTSSSSDLITGSATISASDGTTSATGTVSLAGEFCKFDNLSNDLDLDVEVNNKNGFGDDEEWYPFDEVEVEVTVDNRGDYDIDDIEVEWGLYNPQTGDFIQEDDEKEFNLKNGKDDTVTFTIDLDDDIDDFEDKDFVLYVKATGKFDDSDSPNDGESTCVEASENIKIITEEFVIVNKLDFPEKISCGSDLLISGDAWNIGDNDLDDVEILIRNVELGLSKKIKFNDINKFDNEKFSTNFVIPADAEEKSYQIDFMVFDEDGDIFENNEDDDAEYREFITVEGSCSGTAANAAISATLESGGEAGSALVVKSTITNSGSELQTYTITAANHANWADSVNIDTPTVVLNAGESTTVTLTFDVKNSASGQKTFNIEATSNGETKVQPVSVSIQESAGFLSGITGNVIGGDGNWHLWVIGALNVALVVVIIFVALRIARS